MFENVLKKRSVDTILSTFTKAIDDLAACAEYNRAEARHQQEIELDAKAAREAAQAEAERAAVVCHRIKQLIDASADDTKAVI